MCCGLRATAAQRPGRQVTLLLTGYSISQTKAAGYVEGLKAAGYWCSEAEAVGYTFEEIKRAGYVVENVLALAGLPSQKLQADKLGVFIMCEELKNDYPSYKKAGDDTVMLWHAGEAWYVGPASELGQECGWVSLRDGCLRPEASSGTWQIGDGKVFSRQGKKARSSAREVSKARGANQRLPVVSEGVLRAGSSDLILNADRGLVWRRCLTTTTASAQRPRVARGSLRLGMAADGSTYRSYAALQREISEALRACKVL